ncbi:NUDIX hydrolase [Spirosoma radiotolerans]|uniref:DNA mismatch repair protein MutT n=1 Tax=Spirosoma radiotolerans TaxID=1379870 RepID=A0A0E3ZW36_9BACT|nr:NUDIX domain-containing protein [Spirosoma radiotolerans]AKD56160.1 DNA mismatch repair protein MutT [Spirosoma radiotolerans]
MIHYTHPNRILIALDCIIFGYDGEQLKLLLIKRNMEPEQGRWSLMGGFLHEKEDLEAAAQRILYDLTGLTNTYLEQLQTFGAVARDPVERTISVVYYSLVNIQDQDINAIRAHNASWVNLEEKPNLIFDHDTMVEQALRRLRYKAALHAIGFELLPEKFTIPQLQKLYEAIYTRQLDRRNFSRKILSTDLLIGTGEKDTTSVTKKGQLYRLNTTKYQEYLTDYVSFFPELTLS